jgi:hypothetical protein
MELLNNKVTGSQLLASEWNQVPTELQNIITQSGQTLSDIDLDQVGKGVAQYVANGAYYEDIGTADNINLQLIGLKQRTDSLVDGMLIRFKPAFNNTGVANITFTPAGLPSGLPLFYDDETVLGADELVVDRYSIAIYKDSLAAFILLNPYGKEDIPGKVSLSDEINGIEGVNDKIASTPLALSTAIATVSLAGQGLLKKNWQTLTYINDQQLNFSAGVIINQDASGSMTSFVGGRASAVPLTSNTWYHCFIISDDGLAINTDAGFDTDLNAVNLLADTAGWTNYKWVGAVFTDSVSAITEFDQINDSFYFKDNDTIFGTSYASPEDQTYSVISHSPLNLQTNAIIQAEIIRNSGSSSGFHASLYVRETYKPSVYKDLASLYMNAGGVIGVIKTCARIYVRTDNSSTFEVDVHKTDTTSNLSVNIERYGWEIDRATV